MIDMYDNKNIKDIITNILSKYSIEIKEYFFLRKSENLVYKLESSEGKFYALRIRRIVNDYETKLISELNFLYDLAGGVDFEVPQPIKTNDGSLYTKITDNNEEYACMIFRWVSGEHCNIGATTPEILRSMAVSTGKFHNFSRVYNTKNGYIRNKYDKEWFFGTASWSQHQGFIEKIDSQYINYLLDFNNIIKERLEKIPVNVHNFGLIHYDLIIGNFKFNSNKANILDFDELGWGYYLFDVAHLLFGFVKDENFKLIKSTIVKSYAEITNTMNINEYELNTFIGLQCIAYLNWLYRLYWRDNNLKPLERWIPEIVNRINKLGIINSNS